MLERRGVSQVGRAGPEILLTGPRIGELREQRAVAPGRLRAGLDELLQAHELAQDLGITLLPHGAFGSLQRRLRCVPSAQCSRSARPPG